jgi:hypothetical protein
MQYGTGLFYALADERSAGPQLERSDGLHVQPAVGTNLGGGQDRLRAMRAGDAAWCRIMNSVADLLRPAASYAVEAPEQKNSDHDQHDDSE